EDDDFMSLEPNDYYTESSGNFFNADSNKNY
ncbi:MAG TPA: zinc ribbon domain-containing protein, partial [Ruminococcus sp.]|nr:zinc ribbon domain-containing protein [Ruminococcus sp.]